ncbi:hypothetical protein [Pseudonocardia sp.]|uniref:hypothetical protein n=1 Tax=Pseudonocardia sp. TaxID=60912 RepID=UPI003D0C9A62
MLAVGPRLVMANPAMQALVDPGDREVLLEHMRFVMQRHPTVDETVDLPSGVQVPGARLDDLRG